MRKVLFLLLLSFSFVIYTQAQIDSTSISGINCYTDTGSISVGYQNGIFIQWFWWSKISSEWQNIDTMPDVFVSGTSLPDTLQMTRCGKYKIEFYYNGGANQSIDSFFVSCPLTIMEVDSLNNLLDCFGDTNASLNTHTFGGTLFDPDLSMALSDTLSGDEYYNYFWYRADDNLGTNNFLLNQSSPVLSGVGSGWYQVIVSDSIGCHDTLGYIEIIDPDKLGLNNIILNDVMCYGGMDGDIQVNIFGGNQNYISTWTGPLNFSSNLVNISNLFSGIYDFSVVDSLGCNFDTSFFISEPAFYHPHISSSTSILCYGDSGWLFLDSISGGNDSLEFGWVESGSDSIYASTDLHRIYINDLQYGCRDTIDYLVTAQNEIHVSASVQDVLCYGDSTGVISIDSIYGGVSPYTLQWGGIDILNLTDGDYLLFIIDSLGCTLLDTITVNHQFSEISSNINFTTPLCYGDANGSISFNITGGVSGYTYVWESMSPVAGSNNIINNLSSGSYTLSVTDSLGCFINDTIILYEPELLELTFSNYSQVLSCFGEQTDINALITGGTGPFSIQWNNGATTLQTSIGSGTSICSVVDNNGCPVDETVIIISPDSFRISSIIYTNPATISCDSGGTAMIIVEGGTPPIEYIWSTGETGVSSISDLWGENYWVIAIDSCGNKDSIAFSLESYELITALYYDNINYIASIEIDNTNSTGPFNFEWTYVTTGSIWTNINNSGDSAYSLCQGQYSVTTTDQSNGCTVTDILDVTYDLPNGIVNDTTVTVLADSSLWGQAPYTYLWDDGTTNVHADLCGGDHWVEVTDSNGCTVREDFFIEPIVVNFVPEELLIECELNSKDLELKVEVFGGVLPYTYLWSNGETSNTLTGNLIPNVYGITVMDNNNCFLDTTITIAVLSGECIPNVFTPNNSGENDTWNLDKAFLFSDSFIQVFGRFGRKVFESIGYLEPWDGKNMSGNDVSSGTYFYHIEIGNGYKPIQGNVSVIR
ncbi:MAG: gliding motility-associated C-terminal domain-containing protein [Bacteroidota bacterium]|nr:gliding motility-associated C-terminal domain-containing protein [Bacteroidota bacterium]